MKFTVVVMRPVWFIDNVEGFDDPQNLQYVAKGVESVTAHGAGRKAMKEALEVDSSCIKQQCTEHGPITEDDHDLRELCRNDYTVLGTIKSGCEYQPWINWNKP